MKRITILTLVHWYLPGYKSGGTARTVANMVERLGDDLDFWIITSDRDISDSKPYDDVKVDIWTTIGKAHVFYASPVRRSPSSIMKLIRDTPHDVLYLNSFFDPVFTLYPLLARRLALTSNRPTVMASRGEFSAGALCIKCWLKYSYMILGRVLGLYKELTWQASSDHELDNIKRVMGAVAKNVMVAPDLSPHISRLDVQPNQHSSRDGVLRVCLLSRIAPIKNLDFALHILAKVSVPIEFNIVGPIEDDQYWHRCQALVASLPDHIKVHSWGSVEHAKVATVLREHDLFFLPTKGENFGHVIAEALSVGTPVLLADTTPWRGLERAGVGWDLPLEAEQRFVDAIEKAATMDSNAYTLWRQQVCKYAHEKLADPAVLKASMDLFRKAAENKKWTPQKN